MCPDRLVPGPSSEKVGEYEGKYWLGCSSHVTVLTPGGSG